MASQDFKPALIVVDFQEDFCPPHGSLAVPDGRAIAPTVNTLLGLPFPMKLATRDWHPQKHVSFAANHENAKPYESKTTIVHPEDPSRSYEIRLWPVHCVQMTPGAELVPELAQDLLTKDGIVDKGMVSSVEMYSAFHDPFRVSDSGLSDRLKREGITDVFVVGLAADYCVKATAEHAVEEGFKTFIVEEGTRAVAPNEWGQVRKTLQDGGVNIVSFESDEVQKVKALS